MKRPTILFSVLLSLLSLLAFAPATHAASVFPSIPLGYAYGEYIATPLSASGTATGPLLGPTAQVYIGCSPSTTSEINSNNSVSQAPYSTSGLNQSQIGVTRTATGSFIKAVSTVQNVNLLRGLITAGLVRGVATSTASSTGATSADGGSTFSNLIVAGRSIGTFVAPNTVINLPGIGSATLNERSGPVNGAHSTDYSVNMIDVKISLTNTLGIPIGAHIVVAHASTSDVSTAQPVYLTANAYRLSAHGLLNTSTASIDSLAPAEVSCSGGNSQVSTTSSLPSPVGSTGATTNTASGKNTSTGSSASSSTSIADVNLLSGLITATNVKAQAQANWNGTGSGSSSVVLTNLKIAGITINPSVKPNTRVPLPGVGYVVINEQASINNATESLEYVSALDIHSTLPNVLGLKLGGEIILGHADARAASY